MAQALTSGSAPFSSTIHQAGGLNTMRALILTAALATSLPAASGNPVAAPLAGQAKPHPLLIEGFGIDHVILAVRDLEAARAHFHNRLGFKLPPSGVVGKHASGTKNASAYFANQSYLEILAIDEPDKVKQGKPHVLRFLEGGDGILGFAFSTSAAARTADRLRELGIPHGTPRPGTIERPGSKTPPEPKWLTVDPAPELKLPFFFIQYLSMDYGDIFRNWDSGFAEASSSRYYAQPNTATGLSAIWIVVPAVDEVLERYRRLLSDAGTAVRIPALAAQGVVFPVVRQRLYLLQPAAGSGPAADHVARRGAGVMGVSVAVKSIETAAAHFAREGVKVDSTRNGPMGRTGLMVAPSEAHGFWIEFHEEGK